MIHSVPPSQAKLSRNDDVDLADIRKGQVSIAEQLDIIQQELLEKIDRCEFHESDGKMFIASPASLRTDLSTRQTPRDLIASDGCPPPSHFRARNERLTSEYFSCPEGPRGRRKLSHEMPKPRDPPSRTS